MGAADGSACVAIRKVHPSVKCVLQDRPDVVAAASKWWNENEPEAIKTGQVLIQAINFLEGQPVLDAGGFFLRYVVRHDI